MLPISVSSGRKRSRFPSFSGALNLRFLSKEFRMISENASDVYVEMLNRSLGILSDFSFFPPLELFRWQQFLGVNGVY